MPTKNKPTLQSPMIHHWLGLPRASEINQNRQRSASNILSTKKKQQLSNDKPKHILLSAGLKIVGSSGSAGEVGEGGKTVGEGGTTESGSVGLSTGLGRRNSQQKNQHFTHQVHEAKLLFWSWTPSSFWLLILWSCPQSTNENFMLKPTHQVNQAKLLVCGLLIGSFHSCLWSCPQSRNENIMLKPTHQVNEAKLLFFHLVIRTPSWLLGSCPQSRNENFIRNPPTKSMKPSCCSSRFCSFCSFWSFCSGGAFAGYLACKCWYAKIWCLWLLCQQGAYQPLELQGMEVDCL